MKNCSDLPSRIRAWLVACLCLASLLLSFSTRASIYSAELPDKLFADADMCAYAPCKDVMPQASQFSKRKGDPKYVEAYAAANGSKRLVGYVFLSTDVVDIPGYSGKPIITLIGMDTKGTIVGIRVLKHSEPILLAGIPESELLKFIHQYIGKSAESRMEIGHSEQGDGAIGFDAISGATVTAIAENQLISRCAYEIGKEVGIFKAKAKPPVKFTPINDKLSWDQMVDEGDIQHLLVKPADVGQSDSSRPFMDLYFGDLDDPAIGRSILGDEDYHRLMQDLKPTDHPIFVLGGGMESFKGSGFVRGGIFDRIQVTQGRDTFTFRDTDYHNLYGVVAQGAPAYNESGIFIIRSASFSSAYPWQLTFLASRRDAKTGAKSFLHFDQEYWLPARYIEGGRPKVARPMAAWQRAWEGRKLEIALFVLALAAASAWFAQRDRWTRRSTHKHKPWMSIPRHLIWIVSVVFFGVILKAQPSITQVLTWVHSLIYEWKWTLFLSDPFIFIFWWVIIVSVLIWGRGFFCGYLCPYGSLQHLLYRAGSLLGLKRFQRLLPKSLHDRLRWIKYGVFLTLLGVSFYSMEMAEKLAEIEPFKTTFLVGVWNRSWPFMLFWGVLAGLALLSERPFCKYLCPLGAALAIPSKFRIFGLRRKSECQTCHACAHGCGSLAIDDKGKIDPMECMLCMDCMILYTDDHACPPLVKERKARETAGLPLTKIGKDGYFIPLEVVRREVSRKAAEKQSI